MNETNSRPKPVVLAILDGWGVAPDSPGNAITRAQTPNFDAILKQYFTTTLQASGESVGLKWGEMGNSEVGHLNIGAGKVIYQPQPRIDHRIIDGTFFTNEALLGAIAHVKEHHSQLHIMGLLSDTGVHATIEHLFALLELAQQEHVERVLLHLFLDGRDAPYNSAPKYLKRLEEKIAETGVGTIATISGRYYAMDRDNRWDRIAKAYDAIVSGKADHTFTDAHSAIKESYQQQVFDEQFVPVVIAPEGGSAHVMNDQDAVIFYNFRADRARQITRALTTDTFDGFERSKRVSIKFVAFTEYDSHLPVEVAFPGPKVDHPIAAVVSQANLKQLHIAESEKYAHVTYFINGGREEPFEGEDRELVPSPPVTSYEQKPEMSAPEIREKALRAIESEQYDLIIINFANADMVGHTGNLAATKQAVEMVDRCIGDIARAVLQKHGVMCITADHGNAERMLIPTTGEIDKEHSADPVPFIIIGDSYVNPRIQDSVPDLSTVLPAGYLSDVAPTVFQIMQLAPPDGIEGRSLI